jgi:hypothetical protein
MKLAPVLTLLLVVGCKARERSVLLSDPLLENSKPIGGESVNAPRRQDNLSPWYSIESARLVSDFAYLDSDGKRQFELGILEETIAMIRSAKSVVVASYFLFDSLAPKPGPNPRIPSGSPPTPDMVGLMVAELENKLAADQKFRVFIHLDPINRAYANRLAPAVKRLLAAGAVITYTDLASTPPAVRDVEANVEVPRRRWLATTLPRVSASDAAKATALSKIATMHREGLTGPDVEAKFRDQLFERYLAPAVAAVEHTPAGPVIANAVQPVINSIRSGNPVVVNGKSLDFDGRPVDLEFFYNLLLLKADHRKVLVVDTAPNTFEAMLGSANPHNASLPSANFAVKFSGAAATYAYQVLRENVLHSFRLATRQDFPPDRSVLLPSKFAKGFNAQKELPEAKMSQGAVTSGRRIRFVSEKRIREQLIALLEAVRPSDEVLIQMFYLADPEIVDLIARAATLAKVRLILDPNLDAFGAEKDGSPNRQVAAYLQQAARTNRMDLQIRWYDTHGEQNHAKAMGIYRGDGCQFTTGSANWTQKNLGGPNLETNVILEGDRAICEAYRLAFERYWSNQNGTFTVAYDDQTRRYDIPADDGRKWLVGEFTGLVAW